MAAGKGMRGHRDARRASTTGVTTGDSALQRLASASPRVAAIRAMSARADASPASRASAALQRLADSAVVQRAGLEEEELLQGRFAALQRQGLEDEELMQGRFTPAQRAAQADGGAAMSGSLPAALRDGAQALAGTDLGDVRVTYDSAEPAQVGALAYAQGNEIHLGPGQEHHLPHEAWHTVQQRQGRVAPTGEVAGVALNDDPALEQEADRMGTRALVEGRRRHERGG